MLNTTKASLIIVGLGIKFMSHLTVEAKANIEQADKVLYLVNEPLMKQWIEQTNPNSESLDFLYGKRDFRIDTYADITNYILSNLYKNKHICVVLYGHPTVFSKPALDAAIEAKRDGYYTRILPAISAEDCLFADLMINPGDVGCLSVEATDLIINKRKIDSTCHLIIWQISLIGALNHPDNHNNTHGAEALIKYLSPMYSASHKVILYTASQYPGFDPTIENISLSELPHISTSRTATLYVPPTHIATSDLTILSALISN